MICCHFEFLLMIDDDRIKPGLKNICYMKYFCIESIHTTQNNSTITMRKCSCFLILNPLNPRIQKTAIRNVPDPLILSLRRTLDSFNFELFQDIRPISLTGQPQVNEAGIAAQSGFCRAILPEASNLIGLQ